MKAEQKRRTKKKKEKKKKGKRRRRFKNLLISQLHGVDIRVKEDAYVVEAANTAMTNSVEDLCIFFDLEHNLMGW
jgi:hypothetical protein